MHSYCFILTKPTVVHSTLGCLIPLPIRTVSLHFRANTALLWMRFWGGSSVVISHDKGGQDTSTKDVGRSEKRLKLWHSCVLLILKRLIFTEGTCVIISGGCPCAVTQLASTAQKPTEVRGAGAATQLCIPDHITALVRPVLYEFMGHWKWRKLFCLSVTSRSLESELV